MMGAVTSPTRPLVIVAALVGSLAASALLGACTSDDPGVTLSAEGRKGQELAQANSCAACHSADGSKRTGPTWKDLYGSTVELTNGERVTVDAEYVERAIRDPAAERPKGASSQMPVFDEDRITDRQIESIVAYLRDLSTVDDDQEPTGQ